MRRTPACESAPDSPICVSRAREGVVGRPASGRTGQAEISLDGPRARRYRWPPLRLGSLSGAGDLAAARAGRVAQRRAHVGFERREDPGSDGGGQNRARTAEPYLPGAAAVGRSGVREQGEEATLLPCAQQTVRLVPGSIHAVNVQAKVRLVGVERRACSYDRLAPSVGEELAPLTLENAGYVNRN